MRLIITCTSLAQWHYYIICLILLGLIQATESAAVPSRKSISLYNANDKITILDSQNFSSTVYQSETAWLIEFYASWCGHCQSYVKKYREIAIDTWGWRNVVRVGAINCYSDDNNGICDQHNIRAYPTLRLIEPQALLNTSKVISISATDPKGVEKQLINELDGLNRKNDNWPNFSPMSFATIDDLHAAVAPSVNLVLMIVEERSDFIGRQIMLDFSRFRDQIVVFRSTPNATLWQQLKMNITDLPALFVVFSNGTVENLKVPANTNKTVGTRNLFNYAIRSFIHERKIIKNFDDRDLEEIILSKNAMNEAEQKRKVNDNNKNIPPDTTVQKVNMVDLEAAISYMLRREIPRTKNIESEIYDAVLHWLTVLTKYFPGRPPVMIYLKSLLSKLREKSNGLTGKEFREMADINTPAGYLPYNVVEFKYCAGSSAKYRGYPCSLWMLFHTLTVSQYRSGAEITNMVEIPSAIKKYVKNFFGCRHCSENFMKETENMNELDPRNKYEAMIYLWKVHNSVNKRLHGDVTEDPKHPKVQFPPEHMCKNCRAIKTDGEPEFDLTKTIDFLTQFYGQENIDITAVENFNESGTEKETQSSRSERQADSIPGRMLELDNQPSSHSKWFNSFPSFLRSTWFYFLMVFLLTAIYARRRYCKSKRKRYTL